MFETGATSGAGYAHISAFIIFLINMEMVESSLFNILNIYLEQKRAALLSLQILSTMVHRGRNVTCNYQVTSDRTVTSSSSGDRAVS